MQCCNRGVSCVGLIIFNSLLTETSLPQPSLKIDRDKLSTRANDTYPLAHTHTCYRRGPLYSFNLFLPKRTETDSSKAQFSALTVQALWFEYLRTHLKKCNRNKERKNPFRASEAQADVTRHWTL